MPTDRPSDHTEFDTAREQLVDDLVARDRISDPAVIDALRAVPRHAFVPPAHRSAAYTDRPLPIGDEQTISAPHMVGIIAELLDLSAGDTVLEIGTGRGYHAAVTAELVGPANVYTIEYSEQLATTAREILESLGYGAISVAVGDGRNGWPEHAPYQAAYLTCATPHLPEPIVSQVTVGGTIVAPIGTHRQTLTHYQKREDGSLSQETYGPVRFVRLRG